MQPHVQTFLVAALEEADEAYAVVVAPDGSASVHVGKRRPDGSINLAGADTRGTKLGRVLDEVLGPLIVVAADARMAGFDDLPDEVKALVHEHGNKVHRAYDEGFEAEDIKQMLKARTL